jgi:hypothetical protein
MTDGAKFLGTDRMLGYTVDVLFHKQIKSIKRLNYFSRRHAVNVCNTNKVIYNGSIPSSNVISESL